MIFQHCWVCHISIAGGVNQFVNSFFYVWEVKSERGEVERLLQSEGKWVKLMGLFQSKWSFLISLTLEFMQPDIRFIAIYVFQVLAKYIFFSSWQSVECFVCVIYFMYCVQKFENYNSSSILFGQNWQNRLSISITYPVA